MKRPSHAARLAALASSVLLLLLAAAGCGDNGAAAPPSGAAARDALVAALKAWSDGGKPGELSGTQPPVTVTDTPWSRGDRLKSYEILGEAAGSAGEKQFTVRLNLAKPARTEEVTYHVLGVGPIMVFRDEDYRRNINMENGPSLTRTQARPPGPK